MGVHRCGVAKRECCWAKALRAFDVEFGCLSQTPGLVARSWFGNRFPRLELVFGQRSATLSGRTGCLRKWCGGWGKEKKPERGKYDRRVPVRVSSEEESVQDHSRVKDITLFALIIPLSTETIRFCVTCGPTTQAGSRQPSSHSVDISLWVTTFVRNTQHSGRKSTRIEYSRTLTSPKVARTGFVHVTITSDRMLGRGLARLPLIKKNIDLCD